MTVKEVYYDLLWGGIITSLCLVVLCPTADSEEIEKPKKDEKETNRDNGVALPRVQCVPSGDKLGHQGRQGFVRPRRQEAQGTKTLG